MDQTDVESMGPQQWLTNNVIDHELRDIGRVHGGVSMIPATFSAIFVTGWMELGHGLAM